MTRQKVSAILKAAGLSPTRPNRLGQHMHGDYSIACGVKTIYVTDYTPDHRIAALLAGADNVEVTQ